MTPRILRIVSTFASTVASAPLLIGMVLSSSTGCGMVAAAGNPKVAWAVTDPAPMSIVVRRADAAEATTVEVDRLLTSTPTSLDSDWLTKVGPDADLAAEELKGISQEPVYTQSHARVLAAQVWVMTLQGLKSAKGEHPNLLSTIDPDLGDSYSKIMSKKVEIAGLVALVDQEKVALAAKDISADDKEEHTTTLTKLQKMQADSEAEVAPLETAFLASVKDTAAKASPDVQQKLAPALANLLQALSDADIANSAAALRYPMALPTLPSSVKAVVPGIVADIIQEKTGHRPDLAGRLHATVALHGTDVDVTLDGLEPADLGALKMDELTKETIIRSGKWAMHAVALLGAVSSTKQSLAFETNVLTQILEGFAPAGGIDALAVRIPSLDGSGVAIAPTGGLPSLGGLGKVPGAGAATGVATAALDKKVPGLGGAGTAALDKKVPGLGGVATAALDKKVPGLNGAAGAPGAGTATAALDKKVPGLGSVATAALDKKVPGLSAAAGAPGAGAASAALDKKVPGLGGVATAALDKKVPGLGAATVPGAPGAATATSALDKKVPGAGAAAGVATAALEKKVPGLGALGGKVPGLGGLGGPPGAVESGVPGVGAANAALDKKVPGLGAAASMLEKKIPGGGAIGTAAALGTQAMTDPKAAAKGAATAAAGAALKKVPGGSMLGGLTGFGK